MTRTPALWKAGALTIIITFLVVGAYLGAQHVVEQQKPTATPVTGSAPEWMKQKPKCGTVPLLPCETKGVDR